MPKKEPTWCDIGAVAESIYALTKHADLSHDLLVELAGPALRRLAVMGARIMTDPHGDAVVAPCRPHVLREPAQCRRAALAALAAHVLVIDDDGREDVRAFVGVLPDEAELLLPARRLGRDPDPIRARELAAADALERDAHTHALATADGAWHPHVADERLVGAAVDLEQDVDAGHGRRLAGVRVDRRQRVAEVAALLDDFWATPLERFKALAEERGRQTGTSGS